MEDGTFTISVCTGLQRHACELLDSTHLAQSPTQQTWVQIWKHVQQQSIWCQVFAEAFRWSEPTVIQQYGHMRWGYSLAISTLTSAHRSHMQGLVWPQILLFPQLLIPKDEFIVFPSPPISSLPAHNCHFLDFFLVLSFDEITLKIPRPV